MSNELGCIPPDLLPPNAPAFARALASTLGAISCLPVPVETMRDPWNCPLNVLPWLAWALSVDEWEPDWTEQQKREVVAASLAVHQQKGTPKGVEDALAAAGYTATLTEWHEESPTGDPYTFRIEIDPENSVLTQGDIVSRIIRRTKNVRSRFSGAVIHRQGSLHGIYAVAASAHRFHHHTLEA